MAFFKTITISKNVKQIIGIVNSKEDEEIIELNPTTSSLVIKDLEMNKDVYYNSINGNVFCSSAKELFKDYDSPKKKAVELRLKQKYLNLSTAESFINILFYVDIITAFADEGYFFTNENRQEKYIEIIETGDDKLINMLEEYLTIKDEITSLKWAKSEYLKGIKKLNELDEDSMEFEIFSKSV